MSKLLGLQVDRVHPCLLHIVGEPNGSSLRGRRAACREAFCLPGRRRPHCVPPREEDAQACWHIVLPLWRHVYLGREDELPAGLPLEGLPPRACLPRHGVYPRVAVSATCPGPRVSDSVSVLLTAGSRERRRLRLHGGRGLWQFRCLRTARPHVAALWPFGLSPPHSARRFLRTCVFPAPGHFLPVCLFSRHWVAPWPSCTALPPLCSLSCPHCAGAPRSPPWGCWLSLFGWSRVGLPVWGLFLRLRALHCYSMPATA